MTKEEAKKYADNMTYRDAINNLMKARSIPYRKATFIKINELLKTLEQQPNEDCISRQAALEPYQTLDNSDVISVWMIRKNIEQMPPATPKPKTGQWIVNEQLGNNIQCSECGMLLGLNKEDIDEGWKLPNYCSNCGIMNLMETEK